MARTAPALLLTALAAILLVPLAQAAPVILDNGTVALGIREQGALGVNRPPGPDGGPVGDPVAGATPSRNCGDARTAIRFLPTGDEATWCGRDGEGWGVAAGGASGWVLGGAQGGSLAVASATPTGTGANAGFRTVSMVDRVEATHAFSPSASPNLYLVTVELRNAGPTTLPETLYRRVIHWGAPVAASDSTVADLVRPAGAQPGDSLWRATLEPGPADPSVTWTPDASMEGPPRQADVTGMAAVRQGVTWDFRFRNLHPGEVKSFSLYYGAAADQAAALAALGAVGAQQYALAMRPAADGSADAAEVTFIAAVGGVPDARSAVNDPPEAPSPPCIGVPPGQLMRLRLPEATDLEGDLLDYSVGAMPAGMVYWASNRTLGWVPPEGEVGLSRGVQYTVTEYLLADGRSVRPGTPGIVQEQSDVGDLCLVVQYAVTDRDRDGVGDLQDNCPGEPNRGQEDADGDGIGDPCETQPVDGNATRDPAPAAPLPPDRDGDGVRDAFDRCPDAGDPEQEDADRDGLGDACDQDQDGDNVLEAALHPGDFTDNCPGTWNPDQRDRDGDGMGDSCDPTCRPGTANCTAEAAPPAPGPSAGAGTATRREASLGFVGALAALAASAWRSGRTRRGRQG